MFACCPFVYAFRPRLRSRLTLGGMTLPRKPWVYGEGDSHPLYRYLCRHYHSHTVQKGYSLGCLRSAFTPVWDAPLPLLIRRSATRSFGTNLESR